MRKSRKRSGANSRPQLETLTFFLDRNLGKHKIAARLRSEGIKVEVHDHHLPADAPDEEWIALVGRKGWVAVTRDKNIRYRAAEINAIKKHAAQVIVIRMKHATGPQMAELLVEERHRIARFVAKTKAPFIAGLSRGSIVRAYEI